MEFYMDPLDTNPNRYKPKRNQIGNRPGWNDRHDTFQFRLKA